MAYTLDQNDLWIDMDFEDLADDLTQRRVQFKWDTDLATTLAAMAAHVALWQATTLSGIPEFRVTLKYKDPAVNAQPGAENQENAKVPLALALNPPTGLTKVGILNIPSPDNTVRVGSTGEERNQVDTTDADLVALTDDFKAAGNAYISHGQNATGIKAKNAVIYHRQSKIG